MSHHTELASMITQPQGELIVPYDLVHSGQLTSGTSNVEVGVADMRQHRRELNENGIAYVDMNAAGRLLLKDGEEGLIATNSLAGCTGIAGFAKYDGGSLQFVGHFDRRSEALIIEREYFDPLRAIGSGRNIMPPPESHRVIPSSYNLSEFYKWAVEGGATEVDLVVAYGGHKEDFYALFGLGNYIVHHGNVTSSTEDNKPIKKMYLLPYDDVQRGHYLAAGRYEGREGIFWDGTKLDFESLGRPNMTPRLLSTTALNGEG